MNLSEENWVILTESPACALPVAVLMQLPQAELVSMWNAKNEDAVTGITSEQTSVTEVICVYDKGVSMHVKKELVRVCWVLFLYCSTVNISIFLLENYNLLLSPYRVWFRQPN